MQLLQALPCSILDFLAGLLAYQVPDQLIGKLVL